MILCVRYPQNLELQGIEGLYQKNKRTHDFMCPQGFSLRATRNTEVNGHIGYILLAKK